MNIEKLEKQVAQISARLAEIPNERAALERAPERTERQLANAQADEESQAAEVRQGRGDPEDLAAAMRETSALKATLEKLRRETGPKLEKLDAEEQKLRDELSKVNLDIARAKFADAVVRYEAALKPALECADEVQRLSHLAGIALERDALIDRPETVGGYPLFSRRPW